MPGGNGCAARQISGAVGGIVQYGCRNGRTVSETRLCRELEPSLFMECCYKADLVFLVVSKEEQKFAMEQVSADLKAEICKDHVRISFENGCQTGRAEDLADMMYQILQ